MIAGVPRRTGSPAGSHRSQDRIRNGAIRYPLARVWRNGTGCLAAMVADSNATETLAVTGDRLSSLVFSGWNRAAEYRCEQANPLVIGTKRSLDQQVRTDIQFSAATGVYVFASASVATAARNFVHGRRIVESSLGFIRSALFCGWLLAAGFPLAA